MVTGRATKMVPQGLPLGTDPASVRRRIEALERLLDRAFIVPVLNRPIGLDAIVGLVPVAGDTIGAAMGLYLLWEARNVGMSKWQMTRMAGTVGFDWLLGSVPLAGDVFDFFYQSNSRNLKRIRRHLDRHHPGTGIIEG
jgi:Domain of unknown function (DUF4112)